MWFIKTYVFRICVNLSKRTSFKKLNLRAKCLLFRILIIQVKKNMIELVFILYFLYAFSKSDISLTLIASFNVKSRHNDSRFTLFSIFCNLMIYIYIHTYVRWVHLYIYFAVLVGLDVIPILILLKFTKSYN